MPIRSFLSGTVATLAILSAIPASAASSEQQEIEALKRQMQAQIDYLKRQVEILSEKEKADQAQQQANQQKVDTAVAAVAKVTPPKGKKGVQIGGVTVTPGGFIEAAGIYRDKNMTSDIDTNFNNIPFANSSNYHVDENRFTARQSRLSLLATGNVDSTTQATAYYEMDFLGAAGTANSKQSNSYNLRIRNIYATIDWNDWGLHLMGGQSWSLATMYSKGLLPRDEQVPLTIDAHYAVGFDWTRQPGFRIVKDFDKTLWLGLSVENAQMTTGGTIPANVNLVTNTSGGLFDPNTAYSIDAAPDIIAKVAWDPGFGHYELYGIASFFRDRANHQNNTDVAGGVGAGAIVPIIPKMLEFQLSGLVGQGIGRYGTSQLPDATFGADGSLHPLTAYSILGGLIGHPDPSLDVYLYAGLEHADRWYENIGANHYGYGNPALNNSGCFVEGGTCTANTRDIMEGSAGFWWKFYQGDFGSVRWGGQFEYITRNIWSGTNGGAGRPGGGSTDDAILMTSFRYYPF
ncbi:MAG TPA: hypothetical protein VKZ79_13880 [Alphaproteobacteria bacterium]|nr:hypothetical protein [Alphaproteobacteria bacterium]